MFDDPKVAVYSICMVIGGLMILGSIFLVFKQKILVDRETGKETSVDLPFFGKLKTNYPGLVIFFLGCALVLFPAFKVENIYPTFSVEGNGKVDAGEIKVFIAIGPDLIARDKGSFQIDAPFTDRFQEYDILYISNGSIISHQSIRIKNPGETASAEKDVELQ